MSINDYHATLLNCRVFGKSNLPIFKKFARFTFFPTHFCNIRYMLRCLQAVHVVLLTFDLFPAHKNIARLPISF